MTLVTVWSLIQGDILTAKPLNISTFMTKSTLLLSAATLLFVANSCNKADDAEPQYGTIGDYVWADANSNGQQDSGELPVAGVKVVLYDGAGTRKLDSTITSSTGAYAYEKLASGSYKLRFTAPSGTIATTPSTGSDATDSDINALGWSHNITINVSKALPDTLRINKQVDAGFRAQTSFAKDVNAILVASCQPCHLEGGGANFVARMKHVNNFAIAIGAATFILDRVSRAQGAAGMMPLGRTRLTDDKIAIIKKWIDDGLAE